MYEAFFGLRERPFDLTPSPHFLVMTECHREALRNFEHGVSNHTGVMLLLGDTGSGKTTVIRAAMAAHPEWAHCVHLTNPRLSREEFTEMIARHFRLSPQACRSSAAMVVELEALLEDRVRRGEMSVLIVDEAQSMPLELLQELPFLSKVETGEVKLLRIVLAGRPEFAERLNKHDLRPLKQCITSRCEIQPLARQETDAYVARRMEVAGGAARVFTAEAMTLLHEVSRGLPRTISVIADNALLAAFAEGRHIVDRDILEAVCVDFDLPMPAGARVSRPYRASKGARVSYGSLIKTAPAEPLPLAIKPANPRVLPAEPVLRKIGGFRAAVRLIALLLAIAAGIVVRRDGQPDKRADRSADSTAETSAASILRSSATQAVVPTVAPGAAAPSVDVSASDPGRGSGDSSDTASSAWTRPWDRAGAPPERSPAVVAAAQARRETRPTIVTAGAPELSVAANAVGAQTPVPRTDAQSGPSGPPPVALTAVRPPAEVLSPTMPAVSAASISAPLEDRIVVAARAMPAATSAPASTSAINDAAIRLVVEQYRRAFEALDASGVERFWPGVNARNLQRAFDQIDSQQVAFESCSISAANGSRAQVFCAGSAAFVPKVGNRTPHVESRRWTFHLSYLETGWTIERVESR